MSAPGVFPSRLVVLVALVLSLPSLRQALNGDVTVATAALRFGLALVLGGAAVQLVRSAVPTTQAAGEEAPGPGAGDAAMPARRADDRVDEEPVEAGPAQAA